MKITILFGTESGNSELLARDLADMLGVDHDIEMSDMATAHPAGLDPDALHLVICSTYGDGELPRSAYPFFRSLTDHRPDLSGVRYAMFGLGDSSYVYSYSLGSEIIDRALTDRGAVRVGEYGRHDADVDGDPIDLAGPWAGSALAAATVVR